MWFIINEINNVFRRNLKIYDVYNFFLLICFVYEYKVILIKFKKFYFMLYCSDFDVSYLWMCCGMY